LQFLLLFFQSQCTFLTIECFKYVNKYMLSK